MNSDEVIKRYSNESVGLTLRLIDDKDGFKPVVLIEGHPQALKMVAELLVAVAENPKDDGFSMSPDSAGSKHFSENSEVGFYIHRLPDIRKRK